MKGGLAMYVLLLSTSGAAIAEVPDHRPPQTLRVPDTPILRLDGQPEIRRRYYMKADQYSYVEQERESGVQRT